MRLDPSEADRLRGLLERTTGRRERARLRGLLQFATPEARAAHGALTRQKMRAPGVKEKILDGIARASAPELVVLREAWRNAPPHVREKFLGEVVRIIPAPAGASDG